MKIVDVEVEKLNPAIYNPRKMSDHDFNQLKTSMELFGVVEPVVVNSNKSRKNFVIGGHQRIRAAKDLGLATIPVVYVDLEEERERELNIRLNKNIGDWDWEALSEWDLNLLLDYGFEQWEIDLKMKLPDDIEVDDPVSEYLNGSPEYKNEDQSAYRRIIVNFASEEDVKAFASLIDQKLTDSTKWIWFPAREKRDVKSVGYVADEE